MYSNGPLDKKFTLDHPNQSKENTIVDMGDEFFMVGRPHPMIDGSQRALRIIKEARGSPGGDIAARFHSGLQLLHGPGG